MATQLLHLDPIERISPRIIRILGGNPGKFQLQGTNTYLVGQGPRRILIDTGEGKPAWLESIKQVLRSEQATIDSVILTHWHHDHVSGVPDLLDYLHPERPTVYKSQTVHPEPGEQTDFADGHVFEVEGAKLTAVHVPGHAGDHMALVLAEEDAMFTGDNVLGHGTAVFEDLAAYLKSLARMETLFAGRAYPGHGQWIADGRAKIREYISHRRQREQEIINVLKEAPPREGAEGWGSMEMVRVIYKQYPENLHIPAEGGVKQVLKKLEGEGRVVQLGDESWRLTEKAAL